MQSCQSSFCSACSCLKVSVSTNFDVKAKCFAIMDPTRVLSRSIVTGLLKVGVLISAGVTPAGWLESLRTMSQVMILCRPDVVVPPDIVTNAAVGPSLQLISHVYAMSKSGNKMQNIRTWEKLLFLTCGWFCERINFNATTQSFHLLFIMAISLDERWRGWNKVNLVLIPPNYRAASFLRTSQFIYHQKCFYY